MSEPTAEERRLEYYTAGIMQVRVAFDHDDGATVDYDVRAWYRPWRAPKRSSNPEDGEFSDPGDAAEFELVSVTNAKTHDIVDPAYSWADADYVVFLEQLSKALDEDYAAAKAEAKQGDY